MKDAFPRGATAIVGAATLALEETPGLSNFDLAAHAGVRALAAAGLKPRDVDGLFVVVMDEALAALDFADYLGIQPRFTDNCRTGGSSFQIQASIARARARRGAVRRGVDRLREQSTLCRGQAGFEHFAAVSLGVALSAAASHLAVRARRGPAHASVRHHQGAVG